MRYDNGFMIDECEMRRGSLAYVNFEREMTIHFMSDNFISLYGLEDTSCSRFPFSKEHKWLLFFWHGST